VRPSAHADSQRRRSASARMTFTVPASMSANRVLADELQPLRTVHVRRHCTSSSSGSDSGTWRLAAPLFLKE
jgi:hypothetical protein